MKNFRSLIIGLAGTLMLAQPAISGPLPDPIDTHTAFPDRIVCRMQGGPAGVMVVDLWKKYTQQYDRPTGMIVNVSYEYSGSSATKGVSFRGPLPVNLSQTKIISVSSNFIKHPNSLCRIGASIRQFFNAGQAGKF